MFKEIGSDISMMSGKMKGKRHICASRIYCLDFDNKGTRYRYTDNALHVYQDTNFSTQSALLFLSHHMNLNEELSVAFKFLVGFLKGS